MKQKEYVITDGNKYIKQDINGKYTLTANLSIADVWTANKTAESILYNSIPPYMRYSLYVSELDDGVTVGQETISRKQATQCRNRVATNTENSYRLVKYSFDEDEDVQNMIKGFEDVKKVLSMYANDYMHRQIEDKTMKLNFIVEDIKHYHGKKALNARDGFKLNKLEDEAIIKRISSKNQLEISKKLMKHCTVLSSQIDEICKTISELRAQKYTPRILADLFENDDLDIVLNEYL